MRAKFNITLGIKTLHLRLLLILVRCESVVVTVGNGKQK